MVRILNLWIVVHLAILLSLIALGNLLAYDINFEFVQHVMQMDTTFGHPALIKHAIYSPIVHHIVYGLIIFTEILIALLLWIGCIQGYLCRKNEKKYRNAQTYIFCGLTIGILLFGVGFLSISSEWFASWQSASWNGQRTASMYLFDFLLVYIIVYMDYKNEIHSSTAILR